MVLIPLLILLPLIAGDQIDITFRGLDIKYAFTTNAISTLRETISCRVGINHSEVLLNSIKVGNQSLEFGPNDDVNIAPMSHPYNCHLINTVHWDSPKLNIYGKLLSELKEDIQVTFRMSFTGDFKRAYGTNIIPFLATSIDEYYGDILANDYMAFYISSNPEIVHRPNNFQKMFHGQDSSFLLYMCLGQLGLVLIANCILNRLKKRVIPLRAVNNNYEKIYIITQ